MSMTMTNGTFFEKEVPSRGDGLLILEEPGRDRASRVGWGFGAAGTQHQQSQDEIQGRHAYSTGTMPDTSTPQRCSSASTPSTTFSRAGATWSDSSIPISTVCG